MLRDITKIVSRYHMQHHKSMLLNIILWMIEIVMESKSGDLDIRKYRIILRVLHHQVNNQEILNIAENSIKKPLPKENRNKT